MLNLILLFISLFIAQPTIEPDVKRLEKELQQVSNPTKRLALLDTLFKQYWRSDLNKAIAYGQESIILAQKTGDKKKLSKVMSNMGSAYAVMGNSSKATELFYQSIKIRENIKDSVGLAECYNNLGNIFSYGENEKKALEFYQKALKLKEKIKDDGEVGVILGNIGNIYYKWNQYDKALNYYNKALSLKQDHAFILIAIGRVYGQKKQYDKALSYFQEALKIIRKEKNRNKLDEVIAFQEIASIYMEQQQYEDALNVAKERLKVSKEMGSLNEEYESIFLMKNIYTAQGNYKEALKHLELAVKYQDSIHSQEKEKSLAEMHTRYETEKKEAENRHLKVEYALKQKELETKTMIQYAIGALLAFMAVLAFVFFRGRQKLGAANRLLLTKNKEILEMNDVIRSKMEELERLNGLKDKLFSIISHDLRGPLLSLKSLLEMVDMGALSDHELKGFIRVLENEQRNTITLLDNLLIWAKSQMKGLEIKPGKQNLYLLVSENMALFTAQAKDKGLIMENRVSPDFEVWADGEMIKLVLRNLISNAIKFCRSGDLIIVSAWHADGRAIVSVKDSGTGINQENQEKLFQLGGYSTLGTDQEKGSGLGLMLCKEFVERNGGNIWVKSLPGNGAEFFFSLDIREESKISLLKHHLHTV